MYNDPLAGYPIYVRSDGKKNLENGAFWPYFATDEQLEGLVIINLTKNVPPL